MPEKDARHRNPARAGAKVLASATTVAKARWLADRGIDAVIAMASEAGGHRGSFLTEDMSEQVGTFALVPQIVDAVSVPVIAAGSIADRRGVTAAFALGAAAVQVGTGVSPEMAIRLSKVFGGSPEVWLRMQMHYDLWQAEQKADQIHVERFKPATRPG